MDATVRVRALWFVVSMVGLAWGLGACASNPDAPHPSTSDAGMGRAPIPSGDASDGRDAGVGSHARTDASRADILDAGTLDASFSDAGAMGVMRDGGATGPRGLGFDPGLTLRRAARFYPDRPHYFESCPDGPGGECFGRLGAGDGFYTIIAGQESGLEQECQLNTFAPYDASALNRGVPCPYTFFWSPTHPAFARMGVNSRTFTDARTPNLGWGLMTAIPFPDTYGGVDPMRPEWAPRGQDIASIEYEIRGRVCPPLDPSDPFAIAMHYHYAIFHDDITDVTWTLVTHPFEYVHGTPARHPVPTLATPVQTEGDLGAPPGSHAYVHSIHAHGPALGVSPSGIGFAVDPGCTEPADAYPWQRVTIDLPRLIAELDRRGYVSASVVRRARLVSEIIAGGEVHGRLDVMADVRGHFIHATRE